MKPLLAGQQCNLSISILDVKGRQEIDSSRPFAYDAVMLATLLPLVRTNLLMILRDRLLHAVLLVAVGMILLIPALSSFSMQQTQELAITLSLSGISFVLLLLTLLLGTSSIYRDVERRYVASVLSLPLKRTSYLMAKFLSVAAFLLLTGVVLSIGASLVIAMIAQKFPSEVAVPWLTIILAIAGDIFKYVLLSSVALLLSSVSTSFFLPFFGTLAIYFCGSASQEVFEFVSGEFGQGIHPISQAMIKAVYYILPNFSAFDFKVYAIYALPVSQDSLLLLILYGFFYVAIMLGLAFWSFNRRQFS